MPYKPPKQRAIGEMRKKVSSAVRAFNTAFRERKRTRNPKLTYAANVTLLPTPAMAVQLPASVFCRGAGHASMKNGGKRRPRCSSTTLGSPHSSATVNPARSSRRNSIQQVTVRCRRGPKPTGSGTVLQPEPFSTTSAAHWHAAARPSERLAQHNQYSI
jgi:hypothetical protein